MLPGILRAADLRHLTQPAFGRRITSLEEWAGTTLVDKRRAPVTLTAAGERLLQFAQEAPEFRRKLEESGSTIAPPNVDMPRFLAAETAKYEGIVKFANIRQ